MFKRMCVAACAALIVVGGCTSTVRDVDAGNPEDVIKTMDIGPQDLDKVAKQITTDMKNEAKITPRAGQKKSLVFVSAFENRTGDVTFPTSQLVRTVMNEMTRTETLTAVSQDTRANETAVLQRKAAGQSAVVVEDYTLSGVITRLENQKGGERQFTYYFDFIVNSTQGGDVVLTSQSRIIKAEQKKSFGF